MGERAIFVFFQKFHLHFVSCNFSVTKYKFKYCIDNDDDDNKSHVTRSQQNGNFFLSESGKKG